MLINNAKTRCATDQLGSFRHLYVPLFFDQSDRQVTAATKALPRN